MGSTSNYRSYGRRRAGLFAAVAAIAFACLLVVAQGTSAGVVTAEQIESNLATIWIAILVLFLGAAIMFWRIGHREGEFLATAPPTEPEPPPMLSWRTVRRRDRPAFFRTVAVVLGLCAAGLVYFAMQIQSVVKH